MKQKTLLVGLVLLGLLVVGGLFAQDDGYIYARITTVDDNVYEGPIRWGDEEVFWHEHFNATKPRNNFYKYLDDDDIEQYGSHREVVKIFGIVAYEEQSMTLNPRHVFVARFGDLAGIEIIDAERVEVKLKNNSTHTVSSASEHSSSDIVAKAGKLKITTYDEDDSKTTISLGDNSDVIFSTDNNKISVIRSGSNDVNTKITVLDPTIGEMELDWDRISKIDFLAPTSKPKNTFGKPLYGTVITTDREITGYIVWDHDERLSTEILDGEGRDGDAKIEFGNITSIERKGDESKVTLNSGKSMLLGGTNDVDESNRGLVVHVDGIGQIDIPYDEFRRVTFDHANIKTPAPYSSYKSTNELEGVVKTRDGKTFSGKIVYDLDETHDYEILHGKDDSYEYLVPFRNVKKVDRKNHMYSKVTLRNGSSILLGELQDVSEKNTGFLVFPSSMTIVSSNDVILDDDGDYDYIPWEEIDYVEFK